jgi:hypothetical protein
MNKIEAKSPESYELWHGPYKQKLPLFNDVNIHDAYASWLTGFDWQTYATFTFKHTRHDGCNAVNAVWEKCNEVFGIEAGFYAVEPFKLDGVHLHALLWSPDTLRSGSAHTYFNKAFGWSKFSDITSNTRAVSLYVTKYVIKENDFYLKGESGAWNTAKCYLV